MFISLLLATMAPSPEARIIDKIKSGDQKAFKKLFFEYQPILFRFVFFRLKDRDETEDVVQESFLRIWNRRKTLNENKPILPLLFTIAKRIILDQYKHNQVRISHAEKVKLHLYEKVDPLPEPENIERLENTIRWIIYNKIPRKCGNVFLLSRFENMSNAAIASALGISAKTIEKHITKAIRILKKHLP